MYVLIDDNNGKQVNVSKGKGFATAHPAPTGFTWHEVADFEHRIKVYEVIEGDLTLIDKVVIAPTEEELEKKQILLDYQQREIDGRAYYNNWRANLLWEYNKKTRTKPETISIEKAVRPAMALLLNGDWMSAESTIEEATTNVHFTKPMKDSLLADVVAYISSNY